MPDADDFAGFIRRVRAGDPDAAADLVRRYEPAIRRAARIRIDARHRRRFDSMDICQSVLKSFFVRVALGQYELANPDQLVRLLVRMSRNKAIDEGRKEGARGAGRQSDLDPDRVDRASDSPTPSQAVANQEVLQEALRRLSPEERQLWELRAQGSEWEAVAAQFGGTPEGRRKQLERAVERVAADLHLDE